MIFKAPRVRPGQRITADLWNELATAVDGTIAGPRDLTAGITAEEQAQLTTGDVFDEITRVATTVRITNPEDEGDYVDVSRPGTILYQGSRGLALFRYRN